MPDDDDQDQAPRPPIGDIVRRAFHALREQKPPECVEKGTPLYDAWELARVRDVVNQIYEDFVQYRNDADLAAMRAEIGQFQDRQYDLEQEQHRLDIRLMHLEEARKPKSKPKNRRR